MIYLSVAFPRILNLIGEESALQNTVIVLSKYSGCSASYVTSKYLTSLLPAGFLSYFTEIHPQDVTTSSIIKGILPSFSNAKLTFCSSFQSKSPNHTDELSILIRVLLFTSYSFAEASDSPFII